MLLSERPCRKIVSSAALVFCTTAVNLSVTQTLVVVVGVGVVFAELGASSEKTDTVSDVPETSLLEAISPWPKAVIVSVNVGFTCGRFSTFGVDVNVQDVEVGEPFAPGSKGPVQLSVPLPRNVVPAAQVARPAGADPDL
jgi:hypothetical protein